MQRMKREYTQLDTYLFEYCFSHASAADVYCEKKEIDSHQFLLWHQKKYNEVRASMLLMLHTAVESSPLYMKQASFNVMDFAFVTSFHFMLVG